MKRLTHKPNHVCHQLQLVVRQSCDRINSRLQPGFKVVEKPG